MGASAAATREQSKQVPPGVDSGRGVARSGADAERWFASHGLTASARGLQLFTDEIVTGGFRVARLWHSASDLRTLDARREFLVIVQLEGTVHMRFRDTGAAVHEVAPGDVVIVPVGSRYWMNSAGPVARIEIETVASALPKTVIETFDREVVLPNPSPGTRGILSAAIHTALNSDIEPTDPSFSSFAQAIGHLIAGVVAEDIRARTSGRVLRTEHLYREALKLIALRASDNSFAVASLVKELQLSERYLRRVFADNGTTAQKEIRAARLLLARQYLSDAELQGRRMTLTEVARLSGFRHAQTLRTALVEKE